MIHDLDLIQAFLTTSIRGKELILSNHVLKTQSIYGNKQLFARREGLILSTAIRGNHAQTDFLVNPKSLYYQLIHRLLVERRFIPMTSGSRGGFKAYRSCTIPKGYRIRCTDPRQLWIAWWQNSAQIKRLGLMMNLLLHTRNTWYPLRNLTTSIDGFMAKTLGHEIRLAKQESIVWLEKAPLIEASTSMHR